MPAIFAHSTFSAPADLNIKLPIKPVDAVERTLRVALEDEDLLPHQRARLERALAAL